MSRSPLYNALAALGYIVGIVSLIFVTPKIIPTPEESIFIPIGMLSLLVLSVSVMAYIFFYQPVVMLLKGEHVEAGELFIRTVGIFAIGVALVFLIALAIAV
ncbi:MAG: hypothetical protein KBE09_00995 [Candidatus Pacebacteria bacterium]|nr:hypothetical protein [Candidatus Paceibacterota bacterium]